MAKAKGKKDDRYMADEKVINNVSDFFSKNIIMFVFLFIVVFAGIIVWGVDNYLKRSHNDEVANYCEKELFTPIAKRDNKHQFDVDKIISMTEGCKVRWQALWALGTELFNRATPEDLKNAEKVAVLLQKEAVEKEKQEYQVCANNLLAKIKEEKEFKIPEPSHLGPELPDVSEKKTGNKADSPAENSAKTTSAKTAPAATAPAKTAPAATAPAATAPAAAPPAATAPAAAAPAATAPAKTAPAATAPAATAPAKTTPTKTAPAKIKKSPDTSGGGEPSSK